MDISCAFATSVDTPDHVALAERLGYRRAWFYDSPALYPDVWASMALAAERTSTIGLAPGVLVPGLRHVLVTAAAAAHLEYLAPGRLTLGFGSGFTGRRALGQKAMRWADVADYVIAVKALLRGETIEWDGAPIRLMHPDGFSAALPIEVPIVIAAEGPKGVGVAERLGSGLMTAAMTPPAFDWSVRLLWATVLEDGEEPTSERAINAVGAGAAVAYHGLYETAGREAVLQLPAGDQWLERVEAVDERERHLAVHEGHLVKLGEIDSEVLSPEIISGMSVAMSPDAMRAFVAELGTSGVTEVAYQPQGRDVARELEAFMAAVGS